MGKQRDRERERDGDIWWMETCKSPALRIHTCLLGLQPDILLFLFVTSRFVDTYGRWRGRGMHGWEEKDRQIKIMTENARVFGRFERGRRVRVADCFI